MNAVLLSSKKMGYCTPQGFFDQLDTEFHFALDAAATDKSAKCPLYYTPETDGLKSPWNLRGVLYSATRHMGGKSGNGCGKPMKKFSYRKEWEILQSIQSLAVSCWLPMAAS